jgi:hypothetical protein
MIHRGARNVPCLTEPKGVVIAMPWRSPDKNAVHQAERDLGLHVQNPEYAAHTGCRHINAVSIAQRGLQTAQGSHEAAGMGRDAESFAFSETTAAPVAT